MLPELAALLDLLKSKGVSHYEGPVMGDRSCRITFAPTPDKAPPVESKGLDPDVCRCGHSNAEHTNGLCIAGCDVEACAPEET